MAADGDIWSKEVKFDHPNVKAMAHCQIIQEGSKCKCFNTYDERCDKFKEYDIKDEAALEKKIEQLKKKGYKLKHKNKTKKQDKTETEE